MNLDPLHGESSDPSQIPPRLGKFLLRNDVRPPEDVWSWSGRHREWLQAIRLAQPAQGVVLVESLAAVTEAEDRIKRLETELAWFTERSAHRPAVNLKLRGWSRYFSVGTLEPAYRTVDCYTEALFRQFLVRKHKVPGRESRMRVRPVR